MPLRNNPHQYQLENSFNQTTLYCCISSYIYPSILFLVILADYIFNKNFKDIVKNPILFFGIFIEILFCFQCIKIFTQYYFVRRDYYQYENQYQIDLEARNRRNANQEATHNDRRTREYMENIERRERRERRRYYQQQLNESHPDHPECVTCWENVRSVKLNCGHTVLCHCCAHEILEKLKICPICRKKIRNIKEEIFSDKDYSPSETSYSTSTSSPKTTLNSSGEEDEFDENISGENVSETDENNQANDINQIDESNPVDASNQVEMDEEVEEMDEEVDEMDEEVDE